MSESIYLLTLCLPLGTILLIFGMRYYAAIQQAKALLANDDAYQQMVSRTATVQAETAKVLASIDANLTEMKSRISVLEKILKDVE